MAEGKDDGMTNDEVDQLVDVLAAWATSVDYQKAPIPVWVREAIDRAVDTVAGRP